MHKIATPRPAVELAKLHHAILLCDAAPVRSCRLEQIAETSLVHAECWVEIDVTQLRQRIRPISK